MKKLALAAMAGFIAVSMSGCSKAPEEPVETTTTTAAEAVKETESKGEAAASTGVTIEFLYNLNGESVSDAIQDVCKQFTEETGIGVEAVMPGSNFSDIMKTRMASNQLPDVWTTHGWAVARYAEYLSPLNDFEFASHIAPSIKEQITDGEGNLYTLPIDMDLTGMIYNENVLEEAGVNVDDIKTWADFEEACEKIKAAGLTPIQLGGKDSYTMGNMMDFVAPTLITNEDEANQSALLDGSFDWSKWNVVVNQIDSWRQKGYFNTDAVTADFMTGIKALAADKSAFMFTAASGITETYVQNPDTKMGFMPLPAREAGLKRSLMTGEHFAVGMSKTTKHPEEVKQFMDFLAREDICSYLATKCGMPSGLDNVVSDTGRLAPFYDKYANDSSILNIPYFDRKYLPSGMWNDLCVTGATIVSGQSDSLTVAVDQMKTSYEEKKAQE
ncbi:ABC transporter substrate-binding protein [Lacrimispora indolis]|uniref:ABC transporter substrate-binding protein n=1 Tax=Lacrimispora indolis TaxID=69825 RepID=UPI00045E655D|nr:ABC transporter substrate-binding protein [Lacrimispora indolis]